jgi:hypothetical protein
MMSEHNQRFKGKYQRRLEELDSFEWLLEKCADALGIPCRTFQDWHATRFAMPQTPAAITVLTSLTEGPLKNFEKILKKERDATSEGKLAAAEGQRQLPKPGKRKVEDELDRHAAKKRRGNHDSVFEREAVVRKYVNRI